jgi:PAS domain S-box-containing protein
MSINSIQFKDALSEIFGSNSEEEVRSPRLCIDVTMVIVVVLDKEGRIRLINRHGEKLLGLSESEAIGKHWLDEFAMEMDRDRARMLVNNDGRKTSVEMSIRRPDGSIRLILWNNATIRDAENQPIGIILTGTDITQQAQAAQSLHDSESRFRALLEAVPEAIYVYDEDGTILDVNAAACALHEAERNTLVGTSIWDNLSVDRQDLAQSSVGHLLDGHVSFVEWPEWKLKEHSISVEVRAQSISYRGSQACMLQVRDITERMLARRRLIDMESQARSILDISMDAIFATDRSGEILWVNQSAEKMFRYSAYELMKMNVASLIASNHVQEDDPDSRCIFEVGDDAVVVPQEAAAIDKNGRVFPVEVSIREVVFEEQPRLVSFVRDISERRTLEQEVLRVSEVERQSIGQDIHDLLASKFSGIALMARGLINQLASSPPDEESLEYIVDLARSGATSARALARGLNPVALEQFGLKSALTELRHEVLIMSNLSVKLEVPDDLPELEPAYSAQLYRIGYEAVTNTMKHAEASALSIQVLLDPQHLILQISDDGKGLTREVDDTNGMGLNIMNYRARMLHGLVRIQSSPGNGTTVTCKIPLSVLSLSEQEAEVH